MELDGVRVFVKVAELGSFSRAGEQLGRSKSRISLRVQELEASLGCRLFHRSTRAVQLTEDGAQFLPRAKRFVAEAEELAHMFQAPSTLRGRVRVDLPIGMARGVVIPRLPELLAAHPQLELLLSTTDRRVDVVREGFDCVVRVGALPPSELVARRVGALSMVNCASPGYLVQHGVPRALQDLPNHYVVHYSPRLGADSPSFEYPDGRAYRELPMKSLVTVNATDAYHAAALAGLGIIQVPRSGARQSLAEGKLVEILPELTSQPMPVSLVQVSGRQARRPVRAVLTWLTEVLASYVD